MEEQDVRNAKAFEVVHGDSWKLFTDYLDEALADLVSLDSIDTDNATDYEKIGKNLVNRKGVVSVIRSILNDIETQAETHKALLESLNEDNQIIHRHSENT